MEARKYDRNYQDDSDHYSSSESYSNFTEKNIQQKLSSIVPGSNKDDEELMVADAINYLRSLQERINILEEERRRNTIISKAWVFGENKIGESTFSREALPEIQAKAKGKCVLIRVHCENKKSYLAKVLGELEKLHLIVENISSMIFGEYFLDITITTQTSDEFCMTMKDLKKELREALQ